MDSELPNPEDLDPRGVDPKVLDDCVVSFDPDTGRVMVLASPILDVPMVKESGVWRVGVFVPDDLKDNFEPVTDRNRVSMFLQEALAAASSLNPSRRNP